MLPSIIAESHPFPFLVPFGNKSNIFFHTKPSKTIYLTMTRFTKLAVMIALGLQSLGAMSTSEQADTLTKDQFTSLVESIPDDNVRDNVAMLYQDKKYDGLESALREYIDEYLENSSSAQDRATIEDKKGTVMVKIGNFIANEAREAEGANLENKEDLLGDFLNGLLEPSDKSHTESIEDVESFFLDTIEAEYFVKGVINQLDHDTKAEAIDLLDEKKYDDLKELLEDNVGDLPDTDKIELFGALETLKAAEDSSEDYFEASSEDYFEDSSEDYLNDATMTVEASEQIVQDAIGSLDDEKKTEANSLLADKKYDDLEEFILDNIDLEAIDDIKLIDALETLEIEDDITSEDSEDSSDEMFEDEMSMFEAKDIIQQTINNLDEDMQNEANTMLTQEKYNDLEEFILNNIDPESIDNEEKLFDALEVLLEAENDAPPETSFEIDFEDTEITVEAAEQIVQEAIDSFNGEKKTEANSLFEDKKYDDLEEFILDNIDPESIDNTENLFDALEILLKAENDAPSETSFETTTMTVDEAKQEISNFINKYLSGDSNTKATNLLENDKFEDLEDTILDNVEMDQVTDEKDFEHFADAMMVLTEEEEEESVGDEVDEEEKELSELKETLADTQEELKELLSRINGV